jgi:phage gp36-like protein
MMPPPPPDDDEEPDYIKTLEDITFNFLRRKPFPREHPDRMSLVRLCVQADNEVELTCFLLERGYVELYEEISTSLHHRLYDLPIPIRNRFEECYLKFIAEESNTTFVDDHKTRERGDSVADRIDEIIQKYPLGIATNEMVKDCPKCAICQYQIRKRQHIRKTCDSCCYHRKCCDEFLVQSRTCAICRRILITDS